MKKKIIIFISCFLICISSFFCIDISKNKIFALEEEKTQEQIQEDLENGITDQISKIDFSDLDKLIESFTENQKNIFGSTSFIEKVKQLISGDIEGNYNSIISVIISMLLDGCLKYLPILATIIAIAVLSSIINGARSQKNGGIGEVIHFVCFGIILTLLSKICVDFVSQTVSTINLLKTQSEIIFPIVLTLIAAMGGSISVKLFQPIVLIISNIILNIVSSFLIPILILIFVFTIIGNLTKVIKFNKFADFLSSTFKWSIGFVFTMFTGFLGVKGIMASTFDGVSIKTAKYAMRSYIPLLGGYLSDGFDVILTSSLLIKNAVGAAGIVMIVSTILVPILNLIVFNLFLKLAAGICEPICDERISNFLYGISKIIPYLIVCILAASFMYILTLGFAMITASTLI